MFSPQHWDYTGDSEAAVKSPLAQLGKKYSKGPFISWENQQNFQTTRVRNFFSQGSSVGWQRTDFKQKFSLE